MISKLALGHGIGLRTQHYSQFLESNPSVAWVEIISENFMGLGGRPRAVLEKVRADRPVAMHGVSLGIGSFSEPDWGYLKQLKELMVRLEPVIVSDHLCWSRVGQHQSHDLLPIPHTQEALGLVVQRIQQLQDFLGRQILLENVSRYLSYPDSEMSEWEFLTEVAQRADCGVLLDINNIYVNAQNHQFHAGTFIEAIPVARVGQFHLAGHTQRGDIIIDTHEGHVSEPVWKLYQQAVRRFGNVPTLVEWDEGVPELPVLLAESALAQKYELQAST